MNFNTIPVSILNPGQYVEFDNSRAFTGLLGQRHKALIIGQRTSAGTVAASTPIRITSKAQAQQSFGKSSVLAAMCETFRLNNEDTELWAVALDDVGGGVKAVGTITVTGPATAAGTLALLIDGKSFPVAVANADTATNADVTLPITATSALGVVTMTAVHKGEVGNCIDVRANYYQGEKLPAGLAVVIVCPTGGTTNPAITTALAAVGASQYLTFCEPWTDTTNLTALEAELDTRWDGMHANDGHAFTFVGGTLGDGSTLGDSRNNAHLTIIGMQKSPTSGYRIAAAVAAQDAKEPLPGRPRKELPLLGVLPPSVADRYTRGERGQHLGDGIATYFIDAAGVCRIERLVTTYKLNAQSLDDFSYRDIEILRLLSDIRFQTRARLATVYPRHMLADDGADFDPALPVATPKGIHGELAALGRDLARAARIEKGDEFVSDVVRDETDRNRVNILLVPDLINQLLVMAAQIQYRV
jgi:phage tail sheath gpL-like